MGSPNRDIGQAKDFIARPGYSRHRPEATLLYQLVAEHYPRFRDRRAAEGLALPRYVEDEFDAYLKCGLLEHGFLRVKCDACQAEKLVAFSCKRRGFCPSCGARRMAETAALLVDNVLPEQPLRQWVLSLPFALRYLLATRPEVITQVLGIVYRAISGHLIRQAGLAPLTASIAPRTRLPPAPQPPPAGRLSSHKAAYTSYPPDDVAGILSSIRSVSSSQPVKWTIMLLTPMALARPSSGK